MENHLHATINKNNRSKEERQEPQAEMKLDGRKEG